MCGRYYVDDETSKEIRKLLEQLDAKFQENKRKRGEIFPTNVAPVLIGNNGNVEPELFTWGFPNYKGNGVIINARAETIIEKRMFRESILSRRCIVISNGFYEWDNSKNKIYFSLREEQPVYMAGIYNTFNGNNKFVIITTAANQSMRDVHDRMPLIIEQNNIEKWIFEDKETNHMLKSTPPLLERRADYIQNQLDLF